MIVTLAPFSESWVARIRAVVVFPAPPLGFANEMIGMAAPPVFFGMLPDSYPISYGILLVSDSYAVLKSYRIAYRYLENTI
jgi:hypothetical protein